MTLRWTLHGWRSACCSVNGEDIVKWRAGWLWLSEGRHEASCELFVSAHLLAAMRALVLCALTAAAVAEFSYPLFKQVLSTSVLRCFSLRTRVRLSALR